MNSLGGSLQDDLCLFLDEVQGSGGGGQVRFEGAFLQFLCLLLYLLLLVLQVPFEVVDEEDVFDGIGAVSESVVGLLVLDEAFDLLAGLFAKGLCEFAGPGQSFRFECELFFVGFLPFFGHSLLVKVVKLIEYPCLLLTGVAACFAGAADHGNDEISQFFPPDDQRTVCLCDIAHHLLDEYAFGLAFAQVEVHIEDFLQDEDGSEGVHFFLMDQVSKLCEYLPDD